MLSLLSVQPFHNAMDVKTVSACSPHKRAIITGQFAIRAASIKGHPANTAGVVISDPFPGSNTVPAFHSHLQLGFRLELFIGLLVGSSSFLAGLAVFPVLNARNFASARRLLAHTIRHRRIFVVGHRSHHPVAV